MVTSIRDTIDKNLCFILVLLITDKFERAALAEGTKAINRLFPFCMHLLKNHPKGVVNHPTLGGDINIHDPRVKITPLTAASRQ
jgi:hypothetical protein